jgi:hypothetical protein
MPIFTIVGAVRSGFILPSRVGPRELYAEGEAPDGQLHRWRAPTAKHPDASAGSDKLLAALLYCRMPYPVENI